MVSVLVLLLFVTYATTYELYAPIVDTLHGEVKGSVKLSRNGRQFHSFTGIPFAKPPVGPLRFSAPEDVEPWNGTFDATREVPVCIQRNYLFSSTPHIEGQEDCLYLNVYIPKYQQPKNCIVKQKLLPVLAVAHWGGFIGGRSTTGYFGPEYLMDKDVIFVTFNYRLGPFGFLTTADDEAPGNYGLKDQVLALRWIHNNIESFGGDRNRVTFGGQSAGAGSTHLHMLSAGSKGLFQQAISLSGNALALWAYVDPSIQKLTTAYQASFVGCGNSTDDTKKTINCLRAVSAEDIMKSQDKFKTFYGEPLMIYFPTSENKTKRNPHPFLSKAPLQYLNKGEFNHIPWLVGVVKNEGDLKAGSLVRHTSIRESFNADFASVLTGPLLAFNFMTNDTARLYQNVSDFYFHGKPYIDINKPESIQGLIDIYSDATFYYPLYQSLLLQTTWGHKPIYLYSFEYEGQYSYNSIFSFADAEDINFDWGACHCDDLIYIFSSPDLFNPLTQQTDRDISKKMVDLWTNFIIYGNPNPPENAALPHLDWQPLRKYDNFLHDVQLLNITGSVNDSYSFKISKGFHKQRMEFWKNNDIYQNRGVFK